MGEGQPGGDFIQGFADGLVNIIGIAYHGRPQVDGSVGEQGVSVVLNGGPPGELLSR